MCVNLTCTYKLTYEALHVAVLVGHHLALVGHVHVLSGVEGSFDLLLVDVVQHGLVIVATKLLHEHERFSCRFNCGTIIPKPG